MRYQRAKSRVAAIHDIKRARFPDELVEDVDVMHTASGDNDDGGKAALEGQQRVEFNGGFVRVGKWPWKERKAEVNGGRVQRIGCGLELTRRTVHRRRAWWLAG